MSNQSEFDVSILEGIISTFSEREVNELNTFRK